MKTKWQLIKTYPTEHDPGPDTYWGPEVAVLVPAHKEYPHGPTKYVAHLEADNWLVRDSGEPCCWGQLDVSPTHWAPLPK